MSEVSTESEPEKQGAPRSLRKEAASGGTLRGNSGFVTLRIYPLMQSLAEC